MIRTHYIKNCRGLKSTKMFYSPKDLCSMKVRIGTFQTGPRRNPTKESKTHPSSPIIVAVDAV